MRTTFNIGFGVVVARASAACSGSSSSGESTPPPTAVPAPPPPPAAPSAAPASAAPSAAPALKVEIALATVGNTMTYDKKTLSAPTGALVHLTLKNNATMKTLPHNWLLVQPGTEAKVAAEGLAKAPDAGYFVEGPNVIAHTGLAAPGESTEVTFTAPAPGTYPFICTFPGHYMMMKGTFTVTP